MSTTLLSNKIPSQNVLRVPKKFLKNLKICDIPSPELKTGPKHPKTLANKDKPRGRGQQEDKTPPNGGALEIPLEK